MKKSIVLLLSAALLVSCATGGKNEKVTKEFDQLVQQVKQEFAPDRRDKTFEPQLVYNEENKTYAVKGSTTEAGAVEALVSALKEKGIEAADSRGVRA